MAGHSARFKAAGIDTPKPFIMIDGKPMIARVCDMFGPRDEFYFLCQTAHLKDARWRGVMDSLDVKSRLVPVEPSPLGPVGTLLARPDLLNNDEPVVISYCDFTVQWSPSVFYSEVGEYDGAMPCFRGVQPASFGHTLYAYARVNAQNELQEIREKKSFTPRRHEEFASAGIYYFSEWGKFIKYAQKALARHDHKALPECYVSLAYVPMLEAGEKVLVTAVDKFVCWGTPEWPAAARVLRTPATARPSP
jgi:NDP-sugar pyrophosphorylase family protein